MSVIEFSVGDIVAWSSQAGGYYKMKVGRVIQTVPAHMRPTVMMGTDCGWARKHQSYVVKVNGVPYWPRVSALVKVCKKCHWPMKSEQIGIACPCSSTQTEVTR